MHSHQHFFIREISLQDQAWVKQFLIDHWEDFLIVTPYTIHHGEKLPGFIAINSGEVYRNAIALGDIAGMITYHIQGDQCEIVSLDSLIEGIGIGTALINSVQVAARAKGCRRLWLVTSNDTTQGLRFYQKRGFQLIYLHLNAMGRVRNVKPTVPLIGMHGIPLRDMFELEMDLKGNLSIKAVKS